MRKLNPIFTDKPHSDSDFYMHTNVYQKADGTETTDVSEALLNSSGSPVLLRRSSSRERLPVCTSYPNTFVFEGEQMMQAQTALAQFNERPSQPNVYHDKFDALNYANRCARAFMSNLQTSVNNAEQPSVPGNSSAE